MKPISTREWKFLKTHSITPTVLQCDEWTKRTDFKDFAEASQYAAALGIDLSNLLERAYGHTDFISLEFEATYFFYNWFTKEELEHLTEEEATKALKDWKYFGGFRKWDSGNLQYVEEALEVYNGTRHFYICEDEGEVDVWNYSDDNPHYDENEVGEICTPWRQS